MYTVVVKIPIDREVTEHGESVEMFEEMFLKHLEHVKKTIHKDSRSIYVRTYKFVVSTLIDAMNLTLAATVYLDRFGYENCTVQYYTTI